MPEKLILPNQMNKPVVKVSIEEAFMNIFKRLELLEKSQGEVLNFIQADIKARMKAKENFDKAKQELEKANKPGKET